MRLPSVTRKTDNKNKHDTASWLPDEQEEEMTQEADDILRAIVMKDCGGNNDFVTSNQPEKIILTKDNAGF